MSWSISAKAFSSDSNVVKDAIAEAILAAKATYADSDFAFSAESEQQMAAATQAAALLAASDALGAANKGVSIMISGHANPNHVAPIGYPQDTIGVSVSIA